MSNGRNPVPFNNYEFVNTSNQPARAEIRVYGVPLTPTMSNNAVPPNSHNPSPTVPVELVDVVAFEYEIQVGAGPVMSGRETATQAGTWITSFVVTLNAAGTAVTHTVVVH